MIDTDYICSQTKYTQYILSDMSECLFALL